MYTEAIASAAVIVIIVIVLIVLFARSILNERHPQRKTTHYSIKPILSQHEQDMHRRLARALPNHIVLAQVAANSLIHTYDAPSHALISQMSIDFLVCNTEFEVLFAIEIDDKKTHTHREHGELEIRKKQILDALGVRLVHWHVHALPAEQEIAQQLGA